MRSVSTLTAAIFCLALPGAATFSGPVLAQDDPMVLHAGDTLTWQPAPGHNAMFGDSDNVPFAQVLKLLEFDKDFPCAETDTVCVTEDHPTFTATVRQGLDFAALGAEAGFDFSCAVHTHMDTKMFTVVDGPAGASVRNLVLITKGLAWFIKDPAGDIPIKR